MSEEKMKRALCIFPGLASVFIYIFPYFVDHKNGNIAKYARPRDYHKIVAEKLDTEISKLKKEFPQNKFLGLVDSSPIPEIFTAAALGFGVIGKNNLLHNEVYGSFFFIGEILSDLPCENMGDEIRFCEGCGRCISACPTGALSETGFKKELCISYLTQQKNLTEGQKELLKKGNTIWGCDICQDACPRNKNIKQTEISEFKQDLIYHLDQQILENMDEEAFLSRSFSWRGRNVLNNKF